MEHIDYTYNLYKLKLDENIMPNYNYNEPTFDQEWMSDEVSLNCYI